ncbi:MAG: septum formation protein Maf [Betaproteobacteria bacterium]|nr:septum formation protein Maf [Betaproteobacteria bacterium]
MTRLPIYLASKSPRRLELLQFLPVTVELLLPQAHEDAEALEAYDDHESPSDYVKRVVQAKAQAASRRMQDLCLAPKPILVADTSVALGGKILGKPKDAEEAFRMLQGLSGRRHRVITSVACVKTTGRIILRSEVSKVWFARLRDAEIQAYVDTGDPMDKAGAYAAQDDQGELIERISGSLSNVVGLPMEALARALKGLSEKD